MGNDYSVIGKSVPQIDSWEKVTGKLKFVGDLSLPGVLHAKVLRSPHPHARIVRIDTSKAMALPGVVGLVTHQDCPQKDWVCPGFNWQGPVMGETVRHIGDEVAAVAAVDEEVAEGALDLIEVEYEELPAVFDIEEAMKADAPQVRPDGNTRWPSVSEWGNLDTGFGEADFTVESETHSGRQQHAPLDRNACIASWSGDQLTVWTATHTLYWLQTSIANYFDMPLNKVRVISPPVGGSFGLWWECNFMFIPILLAKKAGRPVRLELTREEVFVAVKRRERSISRIKLGVKNDGKVVAASYVHLFDNGAYGNKFNPWQTDVDLYPVPHGRFESLGISTNLVSAGDMRGVGDATLGYAIEKTIDMVAEKLGMDPVEFSMQSHIRSGDPLRASQEAMFLQAIFNKDVVLTMKSCGLDECLRKGSEAIGWKDKWKGWGKPVTIEGPRRRGIGVSVSLHVSGLSFFGFNGAVVKVNSDGSVQLVTAVGRIGQGAVTALAQVVAEVLGVALEDITISSTDTESCPAAMATVGSASMGMASRTTKKAAEHARGQILQLASQRLGVQPEALDIKDRQVFAKKDPGKGVTLKELMGAPLEQFLCPPMIIGSASEGFPYEDTEKITMAHFAEVEVDTETGKVRVLKYVAAHDSGKIINPAMAENQIQGSVFMALGLALTENLVMDNETGRILNPNLVDYKILGALDLPDPEIIFEETTNPSGAYGAKGLGDGPMGCCCAALSNAVHHAIGVRIDPPITPEKVLRALDAL